MGATGREARVKQPHGASKPSGDAEKHVKKNKNQEAAFRAREEFRFHGRLASAQTLVRAYGLSSDDLY